MWLHNYNHDITNKLMLTYTVHKQNKADSDSVAIYVPEKFSWKACLFAPLWILYHKLWGTFVTYILFVFIIQELVSLEVLDSFSATIMYFGFAILFGFSAHDLFRESLKSQGYKLVDIIIASSEDEAELKYISYHVKQYES